MSNRRSRSNRNDYFRDEPLRAEDELPRELRELRPWPRGVRFEDMPAVERRSVARFGRHDSERFSPMGCSSGWAARDE